LAVRQRGFATRVYVMCSASQRNTTLSTSASAGSCVALPQHRRDDEMTSGYERDRVGPVIVHERPLPASVRTLLWVAGALGGKTATRQHWRMVIRMRRQRQSALLAAVASPVRIAASSSAGRTDRRTGPTARAASSFAAPSERSARAFASARSIARVRLPGPPSRGCARQPTG